MSLYTKLSNKRKELQAKGLLPDWYTTAGYQLFTEKYEYETNGLSLKGQFERIAKTASKHLVGTKYEKDAYGKFFNLMWQGWISLSTPVLSNMGTTRGLPVSCSSSVITDAIEGFYNNRRETAILTKHGFGTSSYLGNIRPRGSSIAGGGKASGVLPVFKGHIQDMQDVSQGSSRRGAFAGYIEITHGDFDELADFIKNTPDDANIGWIIRDSFIASLQSGDAEAIRKYQKVLHIKMLTGRGYFLFIDKVNRRVPISYKNYGLDIKSSNLCVAPETLIYTDKGHLPIASLKDQKVNVWNGEEFSEVTVRQTGSNQKLIKVSIALRLSSAHGQTMEDKSTKIHCTPYHKFYVIKDGVEIQVEAKDLQYGDKLIRNGINQDFCPKVLFVDDENRYDDTYCFTEPKRNKGVFNGILTGNCNEILLHSSEEYTYTCILSSMNILKYDEWKDTDAVFWANVFLDCVVTEFIEQASKISGLEKAVAMTAKGRAVGLGQCGLASYFQSKLIPFESFEAHQLNKDIAYTIANKSLEASKDMAKELGEPDWCKGLGIRNTHRIALPPTKSTALLLGGISEGINPDPAMVYTQKTSAGDMDRVNPILLDLMKKKGVYNTKNIKDVANKQGSVQHVDWLDDHEKLVFRTAFEMDMQAILRMASARSPYLCQWQSLNLFFSADEDEGYISKIHKEAFLDEKILGLYYVYTQAGVQASKDECIACQ